MLKGSIRDREYDKFKSTAQGTAVKVAIVEGGEQSSIATDSIYPAGETVSATKFLYLSTGQVFLAQPNEFIKSVSVGVAKTTGLTGTNIIVQESGDYYDSSFSLTIGEPVYLSANGSITQTEPVTGFRVSLGFAIATNGIRISIQEPIQL